ncbi:MAG: beta-ketoacyl-[acyl-carrier-protein] synthase II [Bradymonadales bacterium]|nr:MAG: beta-ketoacyl-[acyl-carrier-protein] synthase II [Bradymonadales bacterium]
MPARRVVITGSSVISALGCGNDLNWKGLSEGRSGVRKITHFDASGYKTQIAAEVPDFDPSRWLSSKETRGTDLFIQYALASATEMMQASGLLNSESKLSEELADQAAVILGCGLGGLPFIEEGKLTVVEKGPSRLSPFFIPSVISNLAPGQVGLKFGCRGSNYAIASACASGAHAVGEAYRAIVFGTAKVVITGGVESTITPLAIAGFNSMRALSTRNEEPTKASRPFDLNRDGFVVGEGAGLLLLEDYEFALKRGARILAELVGYGSSCDAHHITAPAPEGAGAARAMALALKDAQVNPDQVGAINAHGTSTGLGDIAETQAIKKIFGSAAKGIKVSSTKSMVGHTLGAAGGVEAVYTVMALEKQIVPPTINLDEPDPECDLDFVPHHAQDHAHEYALSNSFGFGGTNVSLLFKRFKG